MDLLLPKCPTSFYNQPKNKTAKILIIVSVALFLGALLFSYYAFEHIDGYGYFGFGYGGWYTWCVIYDFDFLDFFLGEFFNISVFYGYLLIITVIMFVVALIMKKTTEGAELTVTETHAYGKIADGTPVDIPINQITKIAPTSSGAEIYTIVGVNKFPLLKNKNDVLNAIQFLLGNIETEKLHGAAMTPQASNSSEAETLKSFKELYETGVISQEEYEAKKKQILGL